MPIDNTITTKEKLKDKLKLLTPEQLEKLQLALQQKSLENKKENEDTVPLILDAENRFEPFGLTDMQQAYWVGRNEIVSTSNPTHVYAELYGSNITTEEITKAWNTLIKRHDMLRVVFTDEGLQQTLKETLEYVPTIYNLEKQSEEAIQKSIEALRTEMSHQQFNINTWPLFDIRLLQLPENVIRLHISIDGLLADGWSYQILMDELFTIVKSPETILPKLTLTFRDYVIHQLKIKETTQYQEALTYWKERIKTFTNAPQIPMKCTPKQIDNSSFSRVHNELDVNTWKQLKAVIKEQGLTPSVFLLSVFSFVIGLWSKNKEFLINVPRFNRAPIHPEINSIVGEFASFSILDIDWKSDESFLTYANKVKEQLWTDLEHDAVSGVEIVRQVSKAQQNFNDTIAPIVFTCFSSDAETEPLLFKKNDVLKADYSITQTSQVWIDHHVVWSKEGGLHINWDFIQQLFSEELVQQMSYTYMEMLKQLASPEAWNTTGYSLIPNRIFQVPKGETRKEWLFSKASVFEEFTQIAKTYPNKTALICGDKKLTYKELYQKALNVASYIDKKGIQTNETIGILLPKSSTQIVSILGVLVAGGNYLPLDVNIPGNRLKEIVTNGAVKTIITATSFITKFEAFFTNTWLNTDVFEIDNPIDFIPIITSPDDLIYTMYTSGSSGNPKGVMVAQKGVLNAIHATIEEFNISENDVLFGVTAIHHDMSVFDIFGAFLSGATLVLPRTDLAKDPKEWKRCIEEHDVTIWNSVPTLMEMLIETYEYSETLNSKLRYTFLGGDWIALDLPQKIQNQFEEVKVVSVGGPTETTLWNIWHVIDTVLPEWKSIPYGKPIANTTYYLLDDNLEQVPMGTVGEMCVAGVGVAVGYVNDTEATQSKFTIHPITGERIYRTGDLGKMLPSGIIEILGRKDQQIKLNGNRIDPKEIEKHVLEHPEIQKCTVVINTSQRKQLVAFYCGNSQVETSTLRTFLLKQLPEQFIPSKFIYLEQFPITNNGKIDRKRLGVWNIEEEIAENKTITHSNNNIITLKNIVKEVLQIADVTINDDLFALGATSVDIIRIVNQCEARLHFRPNLGQVFQNPTIAGLLIDIPVSKNTEEENQTVFAIPQSLRYPNVEINTVKGRDQFKKEQHYLREDVRSQAIPLEVNLSELRQRRTSRTFKDEILSFSQFSTFLSALQHYEFNGATHANYASPGGLYPCQTYIYIKPNRVENLTEGYYYYHPVKNELHAVALNITMPPTVHVPLINQPIFETASFCVLFVANTAAIAPLYADESIYLSTLEAGYMSQLLATTATESNIGLCPIGKIDFTSIKSHLKISEKHLLIHSLLGGIPESIENPTIEYQEGSI